MWFVHVRERLFEPSRLGGGEVRRLALYGVRNDQYGWFAIVDDAKQLATVSEVE